MNDGDGAMSLTKHGSRTAIWWLVPAAVLAVFWPCLFAGLVYDDYVNFDRNQAVRDLDWLALLTRPYYGPDTTYWRPITSLSMAVAYQAGPFGVHALALVAHALAACVVGAIGRQLLGDPHLAVVAALLFALHPLQVESVAWASALPSVLSGLFLLLAMRAALSWSTGNDVRAPWSTAVWLLCALLAKESGVVAVPLLAIVVFGARGSRPAAAKRAVTVAAVLVCAAWFAVHVAMVGSRRVLGDDGAWVAGVAQMAVRQVALLLVPWPLMPFRDHPHGVGSDALDVAAVVAVAACAVCAIVGWRRLAVRWRIAGALTAVPLLFSAVTHDAVGPHPLMDRYLYVSVSGLALVVTAAVGRRFVALGALAIAYGALTFVQCHVWQDQRAFVTHVRELAPGEASVRVLAGTLELNAGCLRQARSEYRTALDLWPHRTDEFARRQRAAALAGLAWCDFKDSDSVADRLGIALIERFCEALTHDAQYVPAWVGLGVACGMNERSDEALAAFAAALAIDPLCPEAWFNLGRTQLELGRRAEARDSLRRALRCDPGLTVATELLVEIR